MSQNEIIAKRLSELRKEKGVKQDEIAELLNVKRATVANYETGKRTPDYESIIKLADYYGVSCDYIIRGVKSEFAEIHSLTGLNDEAIEALKENEEFNKLFNRLLGYKLGDCNFCDYKNITNLFITKEINLIEIVLNNYVVYLNNLKSMYKLVIEKHKRGEKIASENIDTITNCEHQITCSLYELQEINKKFASYYVKEYENDLENEVRYLKNQISELKILDETRNSRILDTLGLTELLKEGVNNANNS